MIDSNASAPRLPAIGETVIGTDFRIAPGDKSAKQAVLCARLGAAVAMAARYR